MRAYRRTAGALSLLALLSSACQDVPTAVQSSDPREPFDVTRTGPRAMASQKPPEGPNQFWCTYTVDPTGDRREYLLGVHFSDRTLDSEGRTLPYKYIIQDPGGPPLAIYSCKIPRTEAAIQAMGKLLGIPEANRHGTAPPDSFPSAFLSSPQLVAPGIGPAAVGGFGDAKVFKGEPRRRFLFVPKEPGKPRLDTYCFTDSSGQFVCYMDGITGYGDSSGGGGGGMDGGNDTGDAYYNYESGGTGGSGTPSSSYPPIVPSYDEVPNEPYADALKPKCSTTTDDRERAWCVGIDAKQNVNWNARIRDALNRMKLLGGECAKLADRGFSMLEKGNLHIWDADNFAYNDPTHTFGGASSTPGDWVVLDDGWVNKWYGATVFWANGESHNLQQALAHELDHSAGRHHLGWGTSNEDKWHTPYTQQCDGL